MEKKLVLIVLLLLTGCQNKKIIACSFGLDDKNISIDISAINDEISSMKVRSSFEIPNSVLNDSDKYEFLKSQLNDSFHLEDNKLVREYEVAIDDVYSLDKTIERLNGKRYYCE